MRLDLETSLAEQYSNNSQKARVLTEKWVEDQLFCPNCAHASLKAFPNNNPAADFFCTKCMETYELKSSKKAFGKKIAAGAYDTIGETYQFSRKSQFIAAKL